MNERATVLATTTRVAADRCSVDKKFSFSILPAGLAVGLGLENTLPAKHHSLQPASPQKPGPPPRPSSAFRSIFDTGQELVSRKALVREGKHKELAADYADYANGAQKTILDAPHSRNPRNSRLILFPCVFVFIKPAHPLYDLSHHEPNIRTRSHLTAESPAFTARIDDGAARIAAERQPTDTRDRNQSRDASSIGREAFRGLLSGTLRHAGHQPAGNDERQSSNRSRTAIPGLQRSRFGDAEHQSHLPGRGQFQCRSNHRHSGPARHHEG